MRVWIRPPPQLAGSWGGGERVPQPCAWGGRGAEGTRLVCGSRGSWQGLQGRLLLKSRQKVLGGAGALRGGGTARCGAGQRWS